MNDIIPLLALLGMIRGITGNPGGGKTLECIYRLINDLVFTDRHIVTNLTEIKLGALNAYLQKKYPKRIISLDDRLTIIPKTETFEFYRYRSGGLILSVMPATKDDHGHLVPKTIWMKQANDYFKPMLENPEYMIPVTYILSEAHEYFPAREWAQIGRGVTFYASKHRHLHDEVLLETQYPMQIDSQLRMLAGEWYVMQNRYKMSVGPFRQPGGFVRKGFFGVPTGSNEPFETSSYKIDLDIANCYESTGALGLMNRGPETNSHSRTRKLPFWSMWAIGIAATIAVMIFLASVPRLFNAGLGHLLKTTQQTTKDSLHIPDKPTAPTNASGQPFFKLPGPSQMPFPHPPEQSLYQPPKPAETTWDVDDEKPSVTVDSLAIWPDGHADIVLSTGQWITSGDGLIAAIHRNYIKMKDGRVYWISANVGKVSQPGEDPTPPTAPVLPVGSLKKGPPESLLAVAPGRRIDTKETPPEP